MYPRICLFLLLSAVFDTVRAGPAEVEYAAGVAAARGGDLEEAATHFLEAQRAGMDSPSLTYNLGVVSFNLNRLDDAISAFEKLTRHRTWRALAYYNMGLTEERRGEAAAARANFQQARDFATDPKLRVLADRKLRVQGSSTSSQRTGWYGIASIAGGYDDNVSLADDETIDVASDETDQYLEVLAAARRSLGRSDGVTADVTAYYRAHADLNDFDFGSLSGTLLWHQPLSHWRLSTGITGEAQFVGGEPYANVVSHRLQLERRSATASWRVRNDFSYVFAAAEFGFIDGWRNRTQLQISNRGGIGRLKAGYEFETNDRDDLESGDVFSSYSPKRHRIYLGAIFILGPRLALDLEGGLRRSAYDDRNRFPDANGNPIEAARDQDTVLARFRMDYRLSRNWHVWSQYQHTGSDSDVLRYDYSSDAYMIGLETRF